MDLLNLLLNQGGGAPVRQLAGNFGLNEEQAASAISSLLPALGQGLARNASSSGGLESLLAALSTGGHQRYVEDPSILGHEDTVRDGNGILGHILGSKEASRQVAQQAAATSGIGVDVLKKMLPVIAAMVMGTLNRQTAGQTAAEGASTGGLVDVLGQFLGGKQQGPVIDGILGMASKLFEK